jgi:hypothetical protein
MPESGFGTWNGVESYEFVDGVRIHAIGGDQVLLCRVVYEPGKQVPRHAHEHTEQLMAIVEGSVTMTIGDETRELRPGGRRVRQPRHRARALLRGRRDVLRGAGAGAARPRARPRPRSSCWPRVV